MSAQQIHPGLQRQILFQRAAQCQKLARLWALAAHKFVNQPALTRTCFAQYQRGPAALIGPFQVFQGFFLPHKFILRLHKPFPVRVQFGDRLIFQGQHLLHHFGQVAWQVDAFIVIFLGDVVGIFGSLFDVAALNQAAQLPNV